MHKLDLREGCCRARTRCIHENSGADFKEFGSRSSLTQRAPGEDGADFKEVGLINLASEGTLTRDRVETPTVSSCSKETVHDQASCCVDDSLER